MGLLPVSQEKNGPHKRRAEFHAESTHFKKTFAPQYQEQE